MRTPGAAAILGPAILSGGQAGNKTGKPANAPQLPGISRTTRTPEERSNRFLPAAQNLDSRIPNGPKFHLPPLEPRPVESMGVELYWFLPLLPDGGVMLPAGQFCARKAIEV